MNLKVLFDKQRELDQRIVKEKGLEGQDLLPKKILALQVELGELANEWRGFKFWSENQEPRTEHECAICEGEGSITLMTEQIKNGEGERVTYIDCEYCNGDGYLDKNPLLEEYVDCLHFILSIGLELRVKTDYCFEVNSDNKNGVTSSFNLLFALFSETRKNELAYVDAIYVFLLLGQKLGFTWEQIEQAYLEKNKVNHQRQDSGY